MGHIDGGDLKLGQKDAQIFTGFFPEFCIQIGERFIKKNDLGFGHQRTGQGHALLLTAGKLGCRPVLKTLQLYKAQGLFDLAADDISGHLTGLKRIGHVVEDIHVRPDGVGLKDHAKAPVLRGYEDILLGGQDHFTTDFDFTGVRGFQANDAAQEGGLTAPARAQKGENLVSRDRQTYVIQGLDGLTAGVIILTDVFDLDFHYSSNIFLNMAP